ncbi:hypothetical protein QBC45DRAFT_397040 [Copromyces sp. CBS 386.78]|nr:hypothetical protein QBC45DRAFT_397040 [Copromyces sp. CBS 386.78]
MTKSNVSVHHLSHERTTRYSRLSIFPGASTLTRWLRLLARMSQEPSRPILLESGVSNGARVANGTAQQASNSRRLLIWIRCFNTNNFSYQ